MKGSLLLACMRTLPRTSQHPRHETHNTTSRMFLPTTQTFIPATSVMAGGMHFYWRRKRWNAFDSLLPRGVGLPLKRWSDLHNSEGAIWNTLPNPWKWKHVLRVGLESQLLLLVGKTHSLFAALIVTRMIKSKAVRVVSLKTYTDKKMDRNDAHLPHDKRSIGSIAPFLFWPPQMLFQVTSVLLWNEA